MTYDFKVLFATTWMDADDLERRFNELGQQGYSVVAGLPVMAGEQGSEPNNAVIFQRPTQGAH